jgi:hypothetical protein
MEDLTVRGTGLLAVAGDGGVDEKAQQYEKMERGPSPLPVADENPPPSSQPSTITVA